MNEELAIRKLFMRKVKGLIDKSRVAMENDDFKPPKEGIWLEAFLLPAGKESMGKKASDSDEYLGVYQVSIWDQLYTGVKGSITMAQSIVDLFTHGDEYTVDGVTVNIIKTEVSQGFRTGGYWHTPVRITFTSYIERN